MNKKSIVTIIAALLASGGVHGADKDLPIPEPRDVRVSQVDAAERPLLLRLFALIRDAEDKGETPSFVVVSKIKENEYLCHQRVKKITYPAQRTNVDPFGGTDSNVGPRNVRVETVVDISEVFLVRIPAGPPGGADKRETVARAIDKEKKPNALEAGERVPDSRYEVQEEEFEYTADNGEKSKIKIYSTGSDEQLTRERFIKRLKAGEVFRVCPTEPTAKCQICRGFGRIKATDNRAGQDGKVTCPQCGGGGKINVLYMVKW